MKGLYALMFGIGLASCSRPDSRSSIQEVASPQNGCEAEKAELEQRVRRDEQAKSRTACDEQIARVRQEYSTPQPDASTSQYPLEGQPMHPIVKSLTEKKGRYDLLMGRDEGPDFETKRKCQGNDPACVIITELHWGRVSGEYTLKVRKIKENEDTTLGSADYTGKGQQLIGTELTSVEVYDGTGDPREIPATAPEVALEFEKAIAGLQADLDAELNALAQSIPKME